MPYAAEKQATCLQRRGGQGGGITMVNPCRPIMPNGAGAPSFSPYLGPHGQAGTLWVVRGVVGQRWGAEKPV